MNKGRFKNQKQLTTWFAGVSRYYKLEVSVYSLFMAHTKTFAFGAKDCFGIPTKNESTSCLRECDIEVWT